MIGLAKQFVRDRLAARGYTLRWVGLRSTVSGLDFWPDIHQLLDKSRGALVVDVGANVGQSIEAIRDIFDAPQIISFEPAPETFARLTERHGKTPGVRLEQMALGDCESVLPFRLMTRTETHDTSVSDSLLASKEYATGEIVNVPVCTLDAYTARTGLQQIDMLKIDAQGYDLHVLRGATGSLQRRRIRCFSVEVLASELYEDQPHLSDFLAFADQVGYRLNGIYEQAYADNRLHQFNAVFVAPS